MIKKNQILSLYLLLFTCISLTAQVNKNGIPFIKNYTTTDYNASEQNWAICEDQRGVIYVGNTDNGILEFDGNEWRKIPIANGSIVRSLAYSDEGTVYVGGIGEFGYLAPDKDGEMQYHTLVNQLDTVNFLDVWKIYTIDQNVYFCNDRTIFEYSGKKYKREFKQEQGSFLSFKLDSAIYWGNYYDHGLFILKDEQLNPALGGDFYLEKDIFVMLPWSEHEAFIATNGQGLYIYNRLTGLSKEFKSLGPKFRKLNALLDQSQIYNGIKLSSGEYAIATLDRGCLIFNQDGELIYQLDPENGLQDPTVINLFESHDGQLWLGLNKGLSFVELNTPFTKLGQDYGIEGIVLDVIRFNETLFVATNAGVFYLDFDENNLPRFYELPMENALTVWSMTIFKTPGSVEEKLLFATQDHVRQFKSLDESIYISEHPYDCRVLYQSRHLNNRLYVGSRMGLRVLDYNKGKWIDKSSLSDEISFEIIAIAEDETGNVWLGSALNGIIKIEQDGTIKRFAKEEGLPDLNDNKVYFINNQVLTATKKGVFYFNTQNGKFEKYKGFGEKYFLSTHAVKNICSFIENEHWVVLADPVTNIEYIEKLTFIQEGEPRIEIIPFKRLKGNSFYGIFSDGDNGIWFATSDGIYNYQENQKKNFVEEYQNLIRKVNIGIDSVVFWGTYFKDTSSLIVDLVQPNELKKIVKYKHNSFSFSYSTPFWPENEVVYSYMLNGFDEKWSNWEAKTERGYTNLNEGDYAFMVKARNLYGVESEIASYEFSIKPPWYRTLLAYLLYIILAIFVIYVIVKIYTRRLELEKIRLEQIVKERTEEVVKQKDEIEQQRDEIADKNRSITDSIEYASRIQNAVLPSNELAQQILPEHFILFRPRDIVSGDFYWMTKKGNNLVIIAADCTGHGVPGAFMSMLGVSFLNEIVNRHEVTTADAILNSLRSDIKKTMGQKGTEGEAKDGMDIALCIIDQENMKLQYAGAYNPLYLFRDNELIEYKADRMPIGIYVREKESFTNHVIDLHKGDVIYISSDGYQDQFGGEDGQKFKTKNYKELLREIHHEPMVKQKELLNTKIDQWRGEWEQVDDIIVLGIRI